MNRRKLCKALQDEPAALLNSSELKFLDEVNDAIDRKLGSAKYYFRGAKYYFRRGTEGDLEVKSKISALEKDLSLIVKHLKEGGISRLNFAKTYPKWEKNREKCIKQLLEIAQSINTDRFNCNVSKLVGYCTSAVGGGITLVSAILIPFTLGLTTPLAIGGAALTAAGAGTAVGTSITEIALLKSKVDKAKELIDKDKNYFDGMSAWLHHASDLQEALWKVLNFEILKDIPEQIKKFVDDGIDIRKETKRMLHIDKGIGEIIKNMLILMPVRIPLDAVANVISILVTVFLLMINTKNRLIFDCASLTIRSFLGISSLMDNSMNIFRLSKLFSANAAVAKNFATAVTRGAVAAVGIALDVVGIVLTSIDIHKGSLSPEAENIVQAASKLKEEAKVLKKVYKNMPK